MRLSRASRRLAGQLRRRHEHTHRRADAAANAANRAIGKCWQVFLQLLRERHPWQLAERQTWHLFKHFYWEIQARIAFSLENDANFCWRGTVKDIAAAVPRRQLARAAGVAIVREDEGGGEPELLSLQDYLDILFPPPSAADVHAIIFGNQWQERLAAATRLADPGTLASLVANGVIQGKSNQEIAKQVLPVVNNVRASARRIARTESVRVAGAMQMKAHEALGDLVIGFQVHSMHDIHTRPWHLARDGMIYYKEPGTGQKGMDKMPSPPDEPPDPSERPPGTPQTAWNCRCWLSPVLRP